jgi:hypothetical protein
MDFPETGVFWVMSAHIRQPVREQPDTGYRKSLPTDAPAPDLGCGDKRLLVLWMDWGKRDCVFGDFLL